MTSTQIVIVGGGAGGLELATNLARKLGKPGKASITLIDRNRTHLWKPRLHEVAAGVLDANSDELNYAAHARQHGFQFMLGSMRGLDRDKKAVLLEPYCENGETLLPERHVDYDLLVIAVGSQTNDFNTTGASEHCIYLDQRKAAEQFHRSFLNMYLRASHKSHEDEQPKQPFGIAIVGAGATGVELAAELNHAAHTLHEYGFDGISPDNVKISIIEAADRVLPVLSPAASVAIQRQLDSLDIAVYCNERVVEVNAEGLVTGSGLVIPAQLKVWSAGVKAPAFLSQLSGLSCNRINQLEVTATLQTTHDDDIYAMGDCASCQPEGRTQPVPPRAQTAHQQANYLAKAIPARLSSKPIKPFAYYDKGSLISLSKSGSVGNIMGNLSKDFTFEGKLPRLFYITLYRLHQKALHGSFRTLLLILRDRLNKRTGPNLKLH